MQFVLLALVILPVLPNENYGPFAAFNPHETWLMVVLIVGLSVAGYIVYKFFGQNAGTLLGGVLGGLVSSTATTVSYARRTSQQPAGVVQASLVIAIASTVALGRVTSGSRRGGGADISLSRAALGRDVLVDAGLVVCGRSFRSTATSPTCLRLRIPPS